MQHGKRNKLKLIEKETYMQMENREYLIKHKQHWKRNSEQNV